MTAPSVASVQILSWFNITENTGSAPTNVTIQSTFNELNQTLNLNSGTTPAPTVLGLYKTSLSGIVHVDFTAVTDSANGTIDCSSGGGKKLIALAVNNPSASAHAVSIATGGTNGYALPSTYTTQVGGWTTLYFASTLTVVDSTHKTVDISQTSYGTDVPEFAFLFA